MVYFGRASDTFLLGRFRQSSNSAINPLGNVALGVTQQQAGMVDIDDFGCCFRADVTELELANTASQDLVTGGNCCLNCLFPRIVPAMAKHGGRDAFSRLGQQEIRRAVRRVPLQHLPDQGAQGRFRLHPPQA